MPFRWSGLDCLILAGLVHIFWVNWQMGWRLAGLEWLWMWYFMHLLLLWWTSPGLFSWQNRSLREEAEPCRIQLASGCSCLVGLSKWYGLGATYKRGGTQGSSKAWGQQCSQPTTGSISALPPDSRRCEQRQGPGKDLSLFICSVWQRCDEVEMRQMYFRSLAPCLWWLPSMAYLMLEGWTPKDRHCRFVCKGGKSETT